MRLYRPSSKKKSKPHETHVDLDSDNDDNNHNEPDAHDDDDDDDDMGWIRTGCTGSIELPQPPPSVSSSAYRYMTCDAFQEMLRHPSRNGNGITSFYSGQQVFVCKSKGTDNRYELFSRATIVVEQEVEEEEEEEDSNDQGVIPPSTINDNNHNTRRIVVQYPKGSTYRVRPHLLRPIYDTNFMKHQSSVISHPEQQQQQQEEERRLQLDHPTTLLPPWRFSSLPVVVVYPETHEYRRACVIHTVPNTDHFIEIGSAQGQTCHRIHQQQQQNHESNPQKRIVIGIDKSVSCTQQARQRYGHLSTTTHPLYFVTYDIFQPELSNVEDASNYFNDDENVTEILQCLMDGYHHRTGRAVPTTTDPTHSVNRHHHGNNTIDHPHDPSDTNTAAVVSFPTNDPMGLVVAIDINGNRDVAPILQCLQIVMDTQFTSSSSRSACHRPRQPRLIIVKSRSLYYYLQQQQQQNQNQI